MPSAVRDLELDLDAFEGPFDLLLTLVLKEQLEPAEIDVAAIVVAFVEHLTATERIDLDACGEFLVLVAALLEIKARQLFPDESAELSELEPEEAAEELARRLAEYRRMKEAAGWLRERLAEERERYFRLGPAPLAPRAERRLAPQDPAALVAALAGLAAPPPKVSLSHMALRFPPVGQFLEQWLDESVRQTTRPTTYENYSVLVRVHLGDDWLFWCQHCAHVFIVDNECALEMLSGGEGKPCTMVTRRCGR